MVNIVNQKGFFWLISTQQFQLFPPGNSSSINSHSEVGKGRPIKVKLS
jgi:hypothetical protein